MIVPEAVLVPTMLLDVEDTPEFPVLAEHDDEEKILLPVATEMYLEPLFVLDVEGAREFVETLVALPNPEAVDTLNELDCVDKLIPEAELAKKPVYNILEDADAWSPMFGCVPGFGVRVPREPRVDDMAPVCDPVELELELPVPTPNLMAA